MLRRGRLLLTLSGMTLLLPIAVAFLAYSNGANDNFKGVASLFGSRTCGYRMAISWATAATFAGSVTALFLAQALIKKFSGKGLVPDVLVASPQFVLAVALGAGATVILATRLGFPISTTHVSVGALLGMGIVTGQTQWKPVLGVLASWVITLPCAALLSAGFAGLIRLF